MKTTKHVDLLKALNDLLIRFPGSKMLPPLASSEIASLENSFGILPSQLTRLLEKSRGIAIVEGLTVRFDLQLLGGNNFFPRSLLLLTDNSGGFVTLEVNGKSEDVGPVLYFSHDPPILGVLAKTFTEYLSGFEPNPQHSINSAFSPRNQRRAWNNSVPIQAENSPPEKNFVDSDPNYEEWRALLKDQSLVFDLRKADSGVALGWDKFGPNTGFHRFGNELIFGISPPGEQTNSKWKNETGKRTHSTDARIAFPIIRYTGPHLNEKFRFGFGLFATRGHLRLTPFWPELSAFLPGGILDSNGRSFQIVGLAGWRKRPKFLPTMFSGIVFYLRRLFVKFDLELGEAQQLDIEEFKRRIVEIAVGKRAWSSNKKASKDVVYDQLNAARTYEDLIRWLHWFQMTDGGKVI